MTKPPRRLWLTLFSVAALAVLISLGVWQVQRLAWKQRVLQQVASAPTSPVLEVEDVLTAKLAGEDVEWRRLQVRCGPFPAAAPRVVYSVIEGEIAWRALHPCSLVGPGVAVWVDRGVMAQGQGEVQAPAYQAAPPGGIIGLLREDGSLPALGGPLSGYRLVAQGETPQPVDIRPVPVPPEIANNHLGYAITWFGLAAALAGVYVAVIVGDRRRVRTAEAG